MTTNSVDAAANDIADKVDTIADKPADVLAGISPLIDQAKGFAKERPFATAALVGVVGIALLNTLRGKS